MAEVFKGRPIQPAAFGRAFRWVFRAHWEAWSRWQRELRQFALDYRMPRKKAGEGRFLLEEDAIEFRCGGLVRDDAPVEPLPLAREVVEAALHPKVRALRRVLPRPARVRA